MLTLEIYAADIESIETRKICHFFVELIMTDCLQFRSVMDAPNEIIHCYSEQPLFPTVRNKRHEEMIHP